MSMPKRVQRKNGVQGIEKEQKIRASADYCKRNGLSIEKLGQLLLFVDDDSFVFAAPNTVKPFGLTNDIATQPIPVLGGELKDGEIIFRQTPYTDEFLKD